MANRLDLGFADIVLADAMRDQDPMPATDFAVFHDAASPQLDHSFRVVDFLAEMENAADVHFTFPTTWHDEDSRFHTRYPYPAEGLPVVSLADLVLKDPERC